MLLAGGMVTPAMSQEPAEKYVLDLQGAIDHAIAYNKSLQNSRMEVEKSKANIWESIAQGLPQVDGTVDYMTYFNYEMEFSFGSGEAPSFTPEELQLALDQTLATFPGVTANDIYTYSAGSYYESKLSSMLPPSAILLEDASTAKLQDRKSVV